MKICLLTHSLDIQTGAGESAYNITKCIKELLPEVDFSFITSNDLLKPSYFGVFRNLGKIYKRMRDADIIHAMDVYPYGVVAMFVNFLLNKPMIITAIGTGSIQLLSRSGWKAFFSRMVYKRANYITAISRYIAEEIKKEIKSVDVKVINLGVDYKYWSEKGESSLNDKIKNLKPYILSVGELKRRKGYDVILPILGELFKKHIDLNYIIVANVERNFVYRDELYRQIEELGLSKRVYFFSRLSRDDLRFVFQNAHLYLTLPQNINGDVEGFGLTIVQSSGCGTPVIVGRGSGAEDAIINNQSGFLVDSRDKKDVLSKIESILENNVLREKLSIGAKKLAQRQDWINTVAPYVDIYKKILKCKK